MTVLTRRALPAALYLATAAAGLAATAPYPAGSQQSAAEIQDIGEISEAAPGIAGVDGKDAKSIPAPEPVKHFRFNVSARSQYTSNAKLTGDHDSSDFVFFPTVEGGYNTKLGQKFTFDSALRLESGIYGDNTNRSFVGYSLQNTLDFRPQPNLPRIFVGFEPYRYDRFETEGLITEALATSVGSDYGYGFNNGKSLAFVGYTYAVHFANPTIDDRRVGTAIVGLTHSFLPTLTGQLFYQFENSRYFHTDREDIRHAIGLSLTYQFTSHIFSTLSGNWVDNNSNDERASYQTAGASLAVSVQY